MSEILIAIGFFFTGFSIGVITAFKNIINSRKKGDKHIVVYEF